MWCRRCFSPRSSASQKGSYRPGLPRRLGTRRLACDVKLKRAARRPEIRDRERPRFFLLVRLLPAAPVLAAGLPIRKFHSRRRAWQPLAPVEEDGVRLDPIAAVSLHIPPGLNPQGFRFSNLAAALSAVQRKYNFRCWHQT